MGIAQCARSAPVQASTITPPVGHTLSALSALITRAAAARGAAGGGHAGSFGKSWRAARDHLRRDAQPAAAVAPSTRPLLTDARTARAEAPPCDHSPNASAIVLALYRIARSTAAGTDITTAAQS
jgi:hypothetical protein